MLAGLLQEFEMMEDGCCTARCIDHSLRIEKSDVCTTIAGSQMPVAVALSPMKLSGPGKASVERRVASGRMIGLRKKRGGTKGQSDL